MYHMSVQPEVIQTLPSQTTQSVNETALEQTIGVAVIEDFNSQLAEMAETIQNNLNAKKAIQAEIAELESISMRESVTLGGSDYVEVTEDENAALQKKYPELSIIKQEGTFYVSKTRLESTITLKQQERAGLNTNSELLSLQIQSLVDQRKNAITMLSNLIASKNETLMGIIRNLKN